VLMSVKVAAGVSAAGHGMVWLQLVHGAPRAWMNHAKHTHTQSVSSLQRPWVACKEELAQVRMCGVGHTRLQPCKNSAAHLPQVQRPRPAL